MSNIEERQGELEDLESRFMRAYSRCKSVVGWPLVGKRPKQQGLSEEELDEDARQVLDKWMVMLETQVMMWEKTEKKLGEKYHHYSGEEKVPSENVQNGKKTESFIEPSRKLEI